MPIILPSGFNVTSVEPVDARFALANQAARLGLSTANVYKGLLVFQQDNNTLYVLLDPTQPSLNASWQVIGSTVSGSLTVTGSIIALGGFTGSLQGTSSWAINAVSASVTPNALVTASVVSNTITFTKGDGTTFPITVAGGGGGSAFPFTGSAIISGSLQVTGSIVATQGVTASLLGTASYATNALTASFAISSSFAATASFVPNSTSSSFASTASATPNAVITASVSQNTITFTKGDGSTFPITVNTGSGGGTGAGFPFSGSAVITGSLVVTGSIIATQGVTASLLGTASYAINAATASFFSGSISNAVSSSYALTSSFAATASFFSGSVSNAISSSYALTSSFAATASLAISILDQGFVHTQTPTATTWSINHNLNTLTPLVNVYTNDYFQVVPQEIYATSLNNITVLFPTPINGFAIISKGSGTAITASFAISSSFATTASFAANTPFYKIGISGSNTYTITHNLNEDYPIVQVYDAVDREQIIPTAIQSINSNQTFLNIGFIFSGSVVVKK